jgi:DNA modification methylase
VTATLTPNLAVLVPLSKLRVHPSNPRTITASSFERLKHALEADPNHLWQRPLAARTDGTVYCGNMRLLAVQKLGWSEVPVVYEDLPAQEEDLRRLRDNASYGEDDDQAIAELLYHLKEQEADLSLTGLDDAAVSKLLDSVSGEGMPGADDADLTPPEEPTTKPGDLWLLGGHRLLAGDSTNITDVERLMAGRKAHLVYTDPPYGVDYAGGQNAVERERLANDDRDIYGDVIPLISGLTDDHAALYLWFAGQRTRQVSCALEDAGWCVRNLLIWNKLNAHYGAYMAQYMQRHEPFFYAHKDGQTPRWYGPTNEVSVWDVAQPAKNEYHPTQKPVELAERAIRNSSKRGDVVLDLFAGSGSTLIACEGLGRVCYTSEIDPRYCDVVIRRWQTLTRKTATLEPRKEG